VIAIALIGFMATVFGVLRSLATNNWSAAMWASTAVLLWAATIIRLVE